MTAQFECAEFPVRSVDFGATTEYADGHLSVNLDAVRDTALASNLIEDVRVHILTPGDHVRVVHALDAVEPRVRRDGEGVNFPGLLGPPELVGFGRTRRLSGLAIVETSPPVDGEPTYWREAIVDVGGTAAKYSPFGNLFNIVLEFTPAAHLLPGSRNGDQTEEAKDVFSGAGLAKAYNKEVRKAGLAVGVHLAHATTNLQPEAVKSYPDVHPGSNLEGEAGRLPRVAYLYQIQSPYVYGDVAPRGGSIGGSGHLPTLMRPAEILDGAFVNSYNNAACLREPTYLTQNHALVDELCDRHGDDINFQGVIPFTSGVDAAAKERLTNQLVNLCLMLNVDGIVINYMGAGHHEVDVMIACQKLERLGIKCVLMLMEMARKPGDSGFVHFVPEAEAIVSTGNYEEMITIPEVERVVGGDTLFNDEGNAAGPLTVPLHHVLGATDQCGSGTLRGMTY